MTGPRFVPATELCGAFYQQVVRRIVGERAHAAALLGWGSDVLGYDTQRSTDHGWGLRLLVFLADPDDVPAVRECLDAQLPADFAGWPVRYGWDDVAPVHHVVATTLPVWLVEHLGGDATAGMSTLDWLVTPQQRLLGVVGGALYADATGELAAVRDRLRWYPDEVWRWLVACQWRRLAQEEAFVGRTAEVGDDLGSAVTAARLVRDVMRLALLLDRSYAPYQKWLGTAFARLPHRDGLPAHLAAAVGADGAAAREAALAAAYTAVAHRHNATGLTPPVDPAVRGYHGRPFQVLMADRFVDACLATVTDPALRRLPLIGAVDQAVDSSDLLESPELVRRFATLYEV